MANWAWPEIIDEDSARTAAHKGAGWAAIVGGLTALLAIISLVSGSPIIGIDAYSLLDAALFGIIAWRVWVGSRGWAIAGLCIYALEIGYSMVTHPPGISILTILVIFALINGVRGTFALHRYEAERKQALQQQAAAVQVHSTAQAFAAAMPTTGTPPPPPPQTKLS